jgi:hypothetical protein
MIEEEYKRMGPPRWFGRLLLPNFAQRSTAEQATHGGSQSKAFSLLHFSFAVMI